MTQNFTRLSLPIRQQEIFVDEPITADVAQLRGESLTQKSRAKSWFHMILIPYTQHPWFN
jgi:hypothetical protein